MSPTVLASFIQSASALASAAAGSAAAVSLGVSHKHLCALISFAAGTLLATTFTHIVPEAMEKVSIPSIAAALLSGYLLFFLLSRYVSHVCPACAASHFEEHTASDFKALALLITIALGIHSAMDGIALAVGEELGEKASRSIFATITIHKFPEGLALSALLLKAGYGKLKSVVLALALESSTIAGWLIGILLLRGNTEGPFFYWILVHIGGGFLYLALHAVLNESKEHSPRFILAFFLAGVILISLTHYLPT